MARFLWVGILRLTVFQKDRTDLSSDLGSSTGKCRVGRQSRLEKIIDSIAFFL